MGTIGSSFRPWLSCQGICLLDRHQTGDTDSVQPVILLPVQRDSQETFLPCEARMLWYAADRTSSQQLRDTTQKLFLSYLKPSSLPGRCLVSYEGLTNSLRTFNLVAGAYTPLTAHACSSWQSAADTACQQAARARQRRLSVPQRPVGTLGYTPPYRGGRRGS